MMTNLDRLFDVLDFIQVSRAEFEEKYISRASYDELRSENARLSDECARQRQEIADECEKQDAMRGELAQDREDLALANKAMRAAYAVLVDAAKYRYRLDTVELKTAMQAIETALRITPGYWPG